MARWQGTTTERGLGNPHQKGRISALTQLRDGDPCFRCQLRGIYHPMNRDSIYWVDGKPRSDLLDYDDYPGRIYGGPQIKRLSYRACNRSAGARLGNKLRPPRKPGRRYTRW